MNVTHAHETPRGCESGHTIREHQALELWGRRMAVYGNHEAICPRSVHVEEMKCGKLEIRTSGGGICHRAESADFADFT